MEVWVILVPLLAGVAVSLCASSQEAPETTQDSSTALADAIDTHNRAVIRVHEPGPEDRQAPVRIPKAARQCTIVNNQRRCRPFRPGIGSAIGRVEQMENVTDQALQDTSSLTHAPTYI